MKMTTFTIVTVCDDVREVFFRDFLESVVAQNYDNWELYVIDSGRTPGIADITSEFFPSDTRVHYRKLSKHTSRAYGTNIGMHHASNDYILITDCHNRLDANCLYYIADYIFTAESADIIYSDHIDLEGIDKTGIHVKQDFNKELFLRTNYIGDMVVIRREVAYAVGKVREVLSEAYMYEYMIRCMERGYSFSHIPKFLYYKRIMYEEPLPGDESRGVRQFLTQLFAPRDTTRIDTALRESMASVNAYMIRNDISAKVSEASSKDYWKVEYDGAGAQYHDKEYILLRGEGVKVSGRRCLDRMYSYIKLGDVAIVGVRFAGPFWTTANCGYIHDNEGNVYPAFYSIGLRDGGYDNIALIPREISMVDSGFCMISAKAYRNLGGFDSELKGRDVMLDFCIRARKRGYRIIIDPSIIARRTTNDVISEENSHNRLIDKLGDELSKGDRYYSPNFIMGLKNHRFMEAIREEEQNDQSTL